MLPKIEIGFKPMESTTTAGLMLDVSIDRTAGQTIDMDIANEIGG